MQTVCQMEPSYPKFVINATPRHKKSPCILFYVYNADGMFVARYHQEDLALKLALRLGGRVTRETVLI